MVRVSPGLQHVYRFNRADTAQAKSPVRTGGRARSALCTAHAGLSFVHFQAAFMRHTTTSPVRPPWPSALPSAAMELDPLDPFVNFTMDGRSG